MKTVTLKEMANELGCVKVCGLWYTDFYIDMLGNTDSDLGQGVYLSEGVSICEEGMTNDELRQLYKQTCETEQLNPALDIQPVQCSHVHAYFAARARDERNNDIYL